MIALAALAASAAAIAQAPPPPAPPPATLSLYGFPCGTIGISDLGWFSDEFRFQGEKRTLIAGCFLIRHPKGILLWDTGLDPALIRGGTPEMSLDRTIASRLAELKLAPAAITYVGISHYHADHSGGAAGFPRAELLIGAADVTALKAMKPDDPAVKQLAPWLAGGGKLRAVEGDLDLFGDGSVVLLAMPGHTPGHHALLVRLPKSGPVLLSGDEYHFRENRAVRGVPTFNVDRADTLASHDRFEGIAKVLKARVVIQHDPRDMAALPAFPAGLD